MMDDRGNLLQRSTVNWWEVGLRISMTLLNTGLALLFFIVMNADGTNLHPLTDMDMSGTDPAWRP